MLQNVAVVELEESNSESESDSESVSTPGVSDCVGEEGDSDGMEEWQMDGDAGVSASDRSIHRSARHKKIELVSECDNR